MKIVLVTAPADVAEPLARNILEARLAACVSLVPGVRSIYRWKGAVETSDEVQLVVKTSDSKASELTSWIATQHPYEVPEVVVVAVEHAAAAYAKWIEDELRAS